jgi:predicted ATPase
MKCFIMTGAPGAGKTATLGHVSGTQQTAPEAAVLCDSATTNRPSTEGAESAIGSP